MKYIVQGLNTDTNAWETLPYETEDGHVHTTFDLEFMAEYVADEFRRMWPGVYRVAVDFD